MDETVLIGRKSEITAIPRSLWEGHLAQIPAHASERLSFMSPDHHRVRNFAVTELVKAGKPLASGYIAQSLDLPPEHLKLILDELEHHLFFLVCNADGAVAWAYPVTVEPTAHALKFKSGERLYAA
jgi:hypothetical protein